MPRKTSQDLTKKEKNLNFKILAECSSQMTEESDDIRLHKKSCPLQFLLTMRHIHVALCQFYSKLYSLPMKLPLASFYIDIA